MSNIEKLLKRVRNRSEAVMLDTKPEHSGKLNKKVSALFNNKLRPKWEVKTPQILKRISGLHQIRPNKYFKQHYTRRKIKIENCPK